MNARSVGTVILVSLLAVLHAPPTEASTFELELREFDGSNGICGFEIAAEQNSSQPVICTLTTDRSGATGWGTTSFQSSAGRGWVRSRIAADVTSQNGFNFTYGGCSTVQSTVDDIVVSGPAGPATAELSVNISGISVGDSPTTSPPVRIYVGVRSTTPMGATRDSVNSSFEPTVPGVVDMDFSPGPLMVEAGDTLTVELRISMSVALFTDPGDVSKSISVDFADTPSEYGISFSRTGPVFDLPAGYTVSSVDGRIDDNLWTPPIFFDGFECGDTHSWTASQE